MISKSNKILRKRSTKNNSFTWRSSILCFALLLLYSPNLFAQVISNNGAAISVTIGAEVTGKDFENNAGELGNYGTITLSGNYLNIGTTSGNGTFKIGGNWTNNGVFTPGFGTVIFNGSENQSIIRSGGETFNNLSIDNSGAQASKRVILPNDVTVTNILSMKNGVVNTGTYRLFLSNKAATALNYTSTTGSRILGKFERGIDQAQTYLFPLGTSTHYNPANLKPNAAPSSGTILSEFLTSPLPGNAGLPIPDPPVEIDTAYVDGYWSMTSLNGFSSGNVNINLNGSGFISEPIRDITRVIKRTNGGPWIIDGTHSDAVGDVVYRNNLTGGIDNSGTQFALGKANPLITSHPLSLIVCEKTNPSFTVTATGAEPFTYIWLKDGVIIPNGPHYSGNRSQTLTINGAVLADAANYSCVVRDKYLNSTTSNTASLTVMKIPVATVSHAAQDHECSALPFEDIVLGASYYDDITTFFWSRTTPAGINTAIPTSGTGYIIGQALSGSFTNTTDAPITITFTITPVGPSFLNYVGSPDYINCTGNPITATVTVNPTPRVIPINLKPAICYGGTTEITLTTPTVMTMPNSINFNYEVSATGVAGDVAGDFAPGNNLLPGQTLAFSYTNLATPDRIDAVNSVIFAIQPIVVGLGCNAGNIVNSAVEVHPKTIKYNYPGTYGTGILVTKPFTCEMGSGLAALKVIATTGAYPYNINWTGPVGYTNKDSVEIVNLNAGQYKVTIEDNLGCSNDSTINIVSFSPRPQIVATPIQPNTNISCPGGSDGSMKVYVSSGITAPYSFRLNRDGGETLFSGVFTGNYNSEDTSTYKVYTNLTKGSYKLMILDVNGCEVPNITEIKEPAPITVTFQKSDYNGFDLSCRGYSDGSALALPSGGNGSYLYHWYAETGSPPVSSNTNHLDNIPAGKYFVTTTDMLGCTKLDSVTLTDPDGMQLTDFKLSQSADGNSNISCNGGNDGTIEMSISGGSVDYFYSWTGPDGFTATTEDISGLKAGVYKCRINDINGCLMTPSPSFILTEPPPLVVDFTASSSIDGYYNINCRGGTGYINISVSGGSGTGYTYDWSSTDGSGILTGQKDQPNLTAGKYLLVVKDLNNCEKSLEITLTQPTELLSSISVTHITCIAPGFDNGSIDLTVKGGVSPFSYAWSNGSANEDIDNLTEGYYKVTITDINSCSRTDSGRVDLPPSLTYEKTLSDYNGYEISCNNMADGFIRINPTSGQSPFIYNWTGPNGFTSTTQDIDNLKAGDYTMVLTDSNYCTLKEIIPLNEPGEIGMVISLSESKAGGFNVNCAGDATGYIGIEPLNQVKTVNYIWSDGLFGETRMNLPAGIYKVIIVDENNCRASSTITLTEPDSLKFAFDITRPSCPDISNGEIRLNVTGGVVETDYSYRWSDNSSDPALSGIKQGLYKVFVTDLNECSINDSIKIESTNETCLEIPNAISPNDDLINDVWNIGMVELYPEMEIKIFNRWGEIIWRSEKGYPRPWDGTSNGARLPIDSYHYIIDLHNGTKPFLGNVTIVR